MYNHVYKHIRTYNTIYILMYKDVYSTTIPVGQCTHTLTNNLICSRTTLQTVVWKNIFCIWRITTPTSCVISIEPPLHLVFSAYFCLQFASPAQDCICCTLRAYIACLRQRMSLVLPMLELYPLLLLPGRFLS